MFLVGNAHTTTFSGSIENNLAKTPRSPRNTSLKLNKTADKTFAISAPLRELNHQISDMNPTLYSFAG
jgi:hypothetical protein